MSTALTHHSLPRRAMITLPDAAGVEIVCRTGALWITLDNDPRDIVVEAGERFCTTEHRPAIIYALKPSSLALHQGTAAQVAAGTVGTRPVAVAA